MVAKEDMRKLADWLWEIPQSHRSDMRAAARVYGDEKLVGAALEDKSIEQLVNTATLPGVVGPVLAMPDVHEGYGFPIGGVAAVSYPDGVISPGGVGYDINCGVRLMASDLQFDEGDAARCFPDHGHLPHGSQRRGKLWRHQAVSAGDGRRAVQGGPVGGEAGLRHRGRPGAVGVTGEYGRR